MLLVTSLWTAVVFSSIDLKIWIFTNLWLFYLTIFVTIGIMCAMICCYTKFNKVPLNYIVLVIYTLTHTYMIGAVCAQYEPEVVISAAVCTMMMFVGLTFLACYLK